MDDKEQPPAPTAGGDRADSPACGSSEGVLPRRSFDRWLDRELRLLGRLLGTGPSDRLIALIRHHRNPGQGD